MEFLNGVDLNVILIFSGVATYAAKGFTPIKAEEGLSELLQIQMNKQLPDAVGNYVMLEEETEENVSLLRYIDSDGRCVITQHLVQVNWKSIY